LLGEWRDFGQVSIGAKQAPALSIEFLGQSGRQQRNARVAGVNVVLGASRVRKAHPEGVANHPRRIERGEAENYEPLLRAGMFRHAKRGPFKSVLYSRAGRYAGFRSRPRVVPLCAAIP